MPKGTPFPTMGSGSPRWHVGATLQSPLRSPARRMSPPSLGPYRPRTPRSDVPPVASASLRCSAAPANAGVPCAGRIVREMRQRHRRCRKTARRRPPGCREGHRWSPGPRSLGRSFSCMPRRIPGAGPPQLRPAFPPRGWRGSVFRPTCGRRVLAGTRRPDDPIRRTAGSPSDDRGAAARKRPGSPTAPTA